MGRQELVATGGRQEILARGGARQEVLTAAGVPPRQELVTAPRQVGQQSMNAKYWLVKERQIRRWHLQVFYTSGNRPAGQTIHTLVNTSNGPVCKKYYWKKLLNLPDNTMLTMRKVLTPVTVLGTDSKVKTLLPADRIRPQPVQGAQILKTEQIQNIQFYHYITKTFIYITFERIQCCWFSNMVLSSSTSSSCDCGSDARHLCCLWQHWRSVQRGSCLSNFLSRNFTSLWDFESYKKTVLSLMLPFLLCVLPLIASALGSRMFNSFGFLPRIFMNLW